MSARTQNEIYADFLRQHPDDGNRWREWWMKYWMDQVRSYFERGWKLLPCGKYSKRPTAGFKWAARDLTLEETIWHAASGENVAIKTGLRSGVVVLDYDTDSKTFPNVRTLRMRTPKGCQFLCSQDWKTEAMPGKVDALISRLKEETGMESVRAEGQYALLPLSRTCRNDRGGRCDCLEHDFRYREWADPKAELQPFSRVARELLKP